MAQTPKDKQPADTPPARRGRAAPVAMEASVTGHAAFVRAGFADPTLVLRWEEIAGAETARLAHPLRLSEGTGGGVLTLRAEPGAAVFLQHEARSLCERINAYLGRQAVARLKFVQGPLVRRPRPPAPLPTRHPAAATDPARKYKGPEGLRDALLRLAEARRSNLKPGQD